MSDRWWDDPSPFINIYHHLFKLFLIFAYFCLVLAYLSYFYCYFHPVISIWINILHDFSTPNTLW
jgi:hypothetical protein